MVRFFSCLNRGSKTGEYQTGEAEEGGAVSASAVVVELFSSQGCKISPEAELLISRLGRGDFVLSRPVIVLAYHVDYWDHMGWKDPFGSSLWTVRQKAYVEALNLDTLFTPQIVVQGQAPCVGNDEENLLLAIQDASPIPAPTLQATFQRPSPDTLEVSITGGLKTKVDSNGADVMVAMYENGLVTNCPTGENKGLVLSNEFVVRGLEKLCSVKDFSAKKTVTGTVKFPLWDSFDSSKCGIAVFVQSSSYNIFGSQKFELPNDL